MLTISFFILFVLLGKEGIAAGQESSVTFQTRNQVVVARSAAMTRPAISISGKEVSAKELARICGKGFGGVQATGAGQPGLSGKIILWDEVKARDIARIEFSNRRNSMLNAQKNSLIIWGK